MQMFRLNAKGQIGVGERCIEKRGKNLEVVYCPVKPEGVWQYDTVSAAATHRHNTAGIEEHCC